MPYFDRNPSTWSRRTEPPDLPLPLPALFRTPEDYIASPELEAAVNVALMLGQPLLVTGKPGVGKTSLAYVVARSLRLPEPLKFEVKSTTEARDLFYRFDHIRRFRDARTVSDDKPIREYLVLGELGQALLRTHPPTSEVVQKYWNPRVHPLFTQPGRSVVLIDEVDKAPRDVPNDILNEIEHGYFRIDEDDHARVEGVDALRPIILLTSNSEKHLPDAFLRRCVYHHIRFPSREALREIARRRVQAIRMREDDQPITDAHIDDMLDLFDRFQRSEHILRRVPSIAELLAALVLLRRQKAPLPPSVREDPKLAGSLLYALLKDRSDLEHGQRMLVDWQKGAAAAG